MSGQYSDLSDSDGVDEWLEDFAENRQKELENYKRDNPNEEIVGDDIDSSPVGAARGIYKNFNLGKHIEGSIPNQADLLQLRYKFPHEQLGYFLIFNQQKFSPRHPRGMTEREGSDVDVQRLTNAMTRIGFKVRICDNFRTKDVLGKIEKYVVNAEMAKCNAFGLAYLSHGGANGDLATFDGMTNVKKIIDKVKGSTLLAGKPKIFFFQACRGREYMDAQITQVAARSDDRPLTWPREADIICLFATVEGYVAYRKVVDEKSRKVSKSSRRKPVDGSWLVLNLCHQISEWLGNYDEKDPSTDLEFHHLLIRVNAAIALMESKTNDIRTSGKKQVSVIQSQLTKQLYFTDFTKKNQRPSK